MIINCLMPEPLSIKWYISLMSNILTIFMGAFAYALHRADIAPCNKGHFRIAGPWAWTLDPEMLDSGPRFPEISAQKHTKLAASMY